MNQFVKTIEETTMASRLLIAKNLWVNVFVDGENELKFGDQIIGGYHLRLLNFLLPVRRSLRHRAHDQDHGHFQSPRSFFRKYGLIAAPDPGGMEIS